MLLVSYQTLGFITARRGSIDHCLAPSRLSIVSHIAADAAIGLQHRSCKPAVREPALQQRDVQPPRSAAAAAAARAPNEPHP